MNTVNYQPTGIYPQFAFNQAQNSVNAKVNSKTDSFSSDKKETSSLKKAIALGSAALMVAGGVYYKKGVGAINKKAEFLKDKGVQTLDEWKNQALRSDEELNAVKEIFDNAKKHENGIVGKIHSSIQKVSKFFQENFYDYNVKK